jgi:XRE family transcriptional regulator, regulator of sulfur utilization
VAERLPAQAALGRAVRRWRESRGLSQEELGYRAQLHRTFIGALERGERNVTIATMVKVANATEMTLSELARRVEEEQDSADG